MPFLMLEDISVVFESLAEQVLKLDHIFCEHLFHVLTRFY